MSAPAGETGSRVRPARGRQEVLIETPEHWTDLSRMDGEALERVVHGYHARYRALAEEAGVARVILFRNRGAAAGTSLRHPHAQLYALALDPPEMTASDASFRELADELGRCPLCAPEGWDPGFRDRLVHEDDRFVAWVPWAAEAPWEVWITPRRHTGDFRDLTPGEGRGLAELLGRITRAYREAAGDPDYNLLLHSAAVRGSERDALHWWIRLRPRVGQAAGFELLSGIHLNPSSPERDAEVLREEGS